MKKLTFSFFALMLMLSVFAQNTTHYYMGVETDKPQATSTEVTSLQDILPANNTANRVGTLIDFDYYDAPIDFSSAYPLHVYGGFGLVFMGPTHDEGGAVLDETSNFMVTGYSPPNFLAFSNGGFYPTGDRPIGPETISFNQPVSYVEIKAGSMLAETVRMEAYSKEDIIVDIVEITGTDALQTISVTAEEIWKVVISYTGIVLVLDDLYYDTYLAPDNLDLTFNDFTGESQMDWKYASINGVYEDFSDSEAQNWIPITGGWSVNTSGEYQVYNPDYILASSYYNADFTDFTLEFSFTKTSGLNRAMGVAFCGDPGTINSQGFWMSGYFFLMGADGEWSFIRMDAGVPTYLRTWAYGTGINPGFGVFNTIRIIRSGTYTTFFFNDVDQGTIPDGTYTSGKIGLLLADENLIGQGLFDYVSISPPVDESRAGTFENFRVYRNEYIVGSPTTPALTDMLTEFGVYDYYIKAKYDNGHSNPSNHEICWWSEFPVVKKTPYAPDKMWDAYLSDNNALNAPKMYDNFSGITELISGIEFVGFSIDANGIPGNGEDPMEFEISFAEDDAGFPSPQSLDFEASIDLVETDIVYEESIGLYLYYFKYSFPQPVDMSEGWVSIKGSGMGSPDYLFWWSDSPEGDQSSYYWDGASWVYIPGDMAFTLQGGWVPPAPEYLSALLDEDIGAVDLSWQYVVAEKSFQYFKIYRDGSQVGISSTPNYTNNLPAHGDYEYYVTAFFDEGESDPSNPVLINWNDFGVEESAELQVLVYPNPAKDVLYIESLTRLNKVMLYNQFGQEIHHTEGEDLKFEINTSAFPPGIYYLKLQMDNELVYRKVVIGY